MAGEPDVRSFREHGTGRPQQRTWPTHVAVHNGVAHVSGQLPLHAEFEAYGLSQDQIAELRQWSQEWGRDLEQRLNADMDDIGNSPRLPAALLCRALPEPAESDVRASPVLFTGRIR
jgi:hypothetical protein